MQPHGDDGTGDRLCLHDQSSDGLTCRRRPRAQQGPISARHNRTRYRTRAESSAAVRPQIILIGGYAGSEKTEFGRAFAHQTGWTILDNDTLTRPLIQRWLDDLGAPLEDRESPFPNKIRPYEYEALNAAVDENIECGSSSIATAPYLHELTRSLAWSHRTQARADDLNAELSVMWVTCATNTMTLYLRRRAAARDRWKLANWRTY